MRGLSLILTLSVPRLCNCYSSEYEGKHFGIRQNGERGQNHYDPWSYPGVDNSFLNSLSINIDESLFTLEDYEEDYIPVIRLIANEDAIATELIYGMESIWTGSEDKPCSSASIYLDKGVPKLAVVKLKGGMKSDYRYKVDGMWKGVDKQEFEDMLKELKKMWEFLGKYGEPESKDGITDGASENVKIPLPPTAQLGSSPEVTTSPTPTPVTPSTPITLDITIPDPSTVDVHEGVDSGMSYKNYVPKNGHHAKEVRDGSAIIWTSSRDTEHCKTVQSFSRGPLVLVSIDIDPSGPIYYAKDASGSWTLIKKSEFERRMVAMEDIDHQMEQLLLNFKDI